ncbi:unnamed protein product [Meloidogyne enterolobii]|uniref:Uncharacterized protein n=2 Tax=Meloidogyne enterolobii TaxID=390850 RepID=A0ACB0YSW3_MELEN
MPGFKPPVQSKCPKCGKSVYAAEKMVAGGSLDSTNVSPHEAQLFCCKCHGRKYGPKGVGFGVGGGVLTMDMGERFGNREVEMT